MGRSTPTPKMFPAPDAPAVGNAGANVLNQAIAAPQSPIPKVPTLAELMGNNTPQSPAPPQADPTPQPFYGGRSKYEDPNNWDRLSAQYQNY